MKDSIVVLSGGPDSSTLAYWSKDRGYKTSALYLDYGRKGADREKISAEKIASGLGIPFTSLDLNSMGREMGLKYRESLLCQMWDNILDLGPTWMMITSSVYALRQGKDSILMAIHSDDVKTGLREIGPAYVQKLDELIKTAVDKQFEIELPFYNMSKSEIIKLGYELGVPFEDTWSCFYSEPEPCGACPGCEKREDAFEKAGIQDPLTQRKVEVLAKL